MTRLSSFALIAASALLWSVSPGAAGALEPCSLLTAAEAATVIEHPGPPASEDSGISLDCTYSQGDDHLDLNVSVMPSDRGKMATFQAVYDQKDILPLPGVGDLAFEYFPGRDEARYQQRSMVVLKGTTRFTLNFYRKHGEVGGTLNDRFVAIGKAVAGRL